MTACCNANSYAWLLVHCCRYTPSKSNAQFIQVMHNIAELELFTPAHWNACYNVQCRSAIEGLRARVV